MQIEYHRLKPAQEAEIKAIVNSFNTAKTKADKVGSTIKLAAYLNNNKLGSEIICITCIAADRAMQYAVAYYAALEPAKEMKKKPSPKQQVEPTQDATQDAE